MSVSKTKKKVSQLLAVVVIAAWWPVLAMAMNTDDEGKNSLQRLDELIGWFEGDTKPPETAKLSDQEIQQYFCEFTEQKSEELGWSESWQWWHELCHTLGIQQIIGSYVFDKQEKNRSLQWTDEGRYCHVLQTMQSQWRDRLANKQVFELFARENLSTALLNNEPAVVLLFAERARQEPSFKVKLWDLVQQSKSNDDQSAVTAAANALTILNVAGVSFSGRDLRNINTSGANLNGAVLDGADLRGANLAGAWFRHASMNQARLGQARMRGARFGEQTFFKEHTSSVTSVSFSLDGRRLASGSSDNTVQVWDAAVGNGLMGSLKASGGGFGLKQGCEPMAQAIIDSSPLQLFRGHTSCVNSVSFSGDGTRVVSGSDDNTLRVWDVTSGEQIRVFRGHTDAVNSVSFSGDGTRVASGSEDDTVRVWNAAAGNGPLGPLKAASRGFGLKQGAKTLAQASIDSKQLQLLQGHTDSVNSVSFSSDGTQIASGSDDYTVRVWDVTSGKELHVFKGHTDGVNSVSFSGDGTRVVSGSEDNTVRVWDVTSGEQLQLLQGHTGAVNSVSFSRDGTRVVSGSDDNTLRLWDAAAGNGSAGPLKASSGGFGLKQGTEPLAQASIDSAQLQIFEGHAGHVKSVSFSGDATLIASGSSDNTVRLLELGTDQKLHIQLRVRWIAGKPALSLTNADFRGATGLTVDQRRLIEQCGGLIAAGFQGAHFIRP